MLLDIWGMLCQPRLLTCPCAKVPPAQGKGSGDNTRAQKETRQASVPKAPKQPMATDAAAEAHWKGAPTTSDAAQPEDTNDAEGSSAAKSKASSGTRPAHSSVLARVVGSSSRAPG